MKRNGNLVISLDFELLWGVFDLVDYNQKREYFLNTRRIIPYVLDLFSKYELKATWATVGMLFNENWEEWYSNIPQHIPNYTNSALNPYLYGKQIAGQITEELCFAPLLIKEILKTPGQELGTHTYSHYYCLEAGQQNIDFEQDLRKALTLSQSKFGIEINSLVFPRNQLREEYLEICASLGIKNVRANPTNWYWKDTTSMSLGVRLARTADAYLPLGDKTYEVLPLDYSTSPFLQKSSRFLRPVETSQLLRHHKMTRIKAEMTKASKENRIYHLWWHPHNFGDKPEESLRDLESILVHYKNLKQKYDFESLTMEEVRVKFS